MGPPISANFEEPVGNNLQKKHDTRNLTCMGPNRKPLYSKLKDCKQFGILLL